MRKLIASMLLVLLGVGTARAEKAPLPVFGVAGVPRELGTSRDYDRIFALLKASGIDTFLSTFQYVEHPAAKSLGFESDFLPPCSADGPGFAALRRHGIGLVVAADVIYPRGASLPPLAIDPLQSLIACAGRERIFAVLSYDEPVHQGVSEEETRQVYKRVKQIDASLPVLMVHAPMIVDQPAYATEAGRHRYLGAVARYSRNADIVGFDVYPIPRDIAKVCTPDSEGTVVGHATAIRGYTAWLRREVPGKRLMMVLQGFSYVDQFEPDFLAGIASASTIAAVKAPTGAELAEMLRLSIEGGAGMVFWWGPSLIRNAAAQPWPELLSVTRAMKAAR